MANIAERNLCTKGQSNKSKWNWSNKAVLLTKSLLCSRGTQRGCCKI